MIYLILTCMVLVVAWGINTEIIRRREKKIYEIRIKALNEIINAPPDDKDLEIKKLKRKVMELQAEKHKGFNVDFDKFFAAYDRWKGKNHALKELENP